MAELVAPEDEPAFLININDDTAQTATVFSVLLTDDGNGSGSSSGTKSFGYVGG